MFIGIISVLNLHKTFQQNSNAEEGGTLFYAQK